MRGTIQEIISNKIENVNRILPKKERKKEKKIMAGRYLCHIANFSDEVSDLARNDVLIPWLGSIYIIYRYLINTYRPMLTNINFMDFLS